METGLCYRHRPRDCSSDPVHMAALSNLRRLRTMRHCSYRALPWTAKRPYILSSKGAAYNVDDILREAGLDPNGVNSGVYNGVWGGSGPVIESTSPATN